jgi:hypothetical protein
VIEEQPVTVGVAQDRLAPEVGLIFGLLVELDALLLELINQRMVCRCRGAPFRYGRPARRPTPSRRGLRRARVRYEPCRPVR